MEKIAKTNHYLITDNEIKRTLGIQQGNIIDIQKDETGWIISVQETNPRSNYNKEEPPETLPEIDWEKEKNKMQGKLRVPPEPQKNELLKELRENKQVPMYAEELKEVAPKKFINPKTEEPEEEEDEEEDDW